MIDTLQAARAFKEAGFTESQADAAVQTMKQAVEGNLVTKADLPVETQELRIEMETLRTEIQSLRADVYRHSWVMGAGVVGVTVGLLKLLS